MSPAVSLAVERMPSPLGEIVALWRGDALVYVDFADGPLRLAALIGRRFPRHALIAGGQGLAPRMAGYFAGARDAFAGVVLDPGGTPFQRRVWEALPTIPYGTTTTYGALAERLGCPRAVRAVGRSNGLNPISIVIPCHRVVGKDGTLTGYAGGLGRKAALLALEGGVSVPAAGA